MKRTSLFLIKLMISLSLLAQETVLNNTLTTQETEQGWQLLFDGHSLNGWKGYNSNSVFSCWSVTDGELICQGEGGNVTSGDLITVSDFDNFELSIDWSISKAGNSGIFYHVIEGKQYDAAYETGPEYQLIDDLGWPEGLEEWQKTGADYAMYTTVINKELMPVGKWNHTRIIYNKRHVEYWLNGIKVVEFQAYTPDWYQKKGQGKWKDYPGYAISTTGHIGLQNHGSGVRFRNIKVKRLK